MARIGIDLSRRIGSVDRRIFGNFIEHLGRCIYGGNFVSGYHWLDGVGSVDDRPRRSELAWYAEESNRFGTNEFIQYCRALGAEPYICVNMGSGTMDEAQAW